MKTQKGFATILGIIIGILIVSGGAYFYVKDDFTPDDSDFGVVLSNEEDSETVENSIADEEVGVELEEDIEELDKDFIACTADAMQCSDGSYVGRTGPNCEFVCPDVQLNCIPEGGFNYQDVLTSTPVEERLSCCSGLVPYKRNDGTADSPSVCVKVEDDLLGGLEFMLVDQDDLVGTATGQKKLVILPVTIEGLVDISQWTAFEGNAGLVKIYGNHDGEEREIASAAIQLDDFDYDTSKKYSFSVTLGDRQWMDKIGSRGSIVFINYSQKDGEIVNMLNVPVVFDIPVN